MSITIPEVIYPKTNAEVVTAICAHPDAMSASTRASRSHASLRRHVANRPGHDWRYAVDSSKMQALNCRPQVPLG